MSVGVGVLVPVGVSIVTDISVALGSYVACRPVAALAPPVAVTEVFPGVMAVEVAFVDTPLEIDQRVFVHDVTWYVRAGGSG